MTRLLLLQIAVFFKKIGSEDGTVYRKVDFNNDSWDFDISKFLQAEIKVINKCKYL